MTDYQQALAEIFAHVDYSRTRQYPYNANTYNLDRMHELCRRMEDPQHDFPSLHIAGSKGKGSTSAMTDAMLQAAGYRTGLYTSPHLHSFRERIRIDGELITQEQLVALWEEARPVVESLDQVTAFEIITLLAFMSFSRSGVDWAVLEVGLGGRLDATNVIQSKACAITSLSYEHTDLLGHTLSLIAFEKAGIIKSGNPVVIGPQTQEAMSIIEDVSMKAGAQIWHVGDSLEVEDEDEAPFDWTWRLQSADQHGIRLDLIGPSQIIKDVWVPLVGYHQAANATVAVALVNSLRRHGVMISPESIRQGLARTFWPGRLECMSHVPLIMLDSAHNRQSAERLQKALDLFPHESLILLFGASIDKDIHGMLEVLASEASEIIVTRSFHPRAADPVDLGNLAREIAPSIPISVFEHTIDALAYAAARTGPQDLMMITGSIFVVADARESWLALHPQAFPPDDWVHHAEPIDGVFTPMLTSPEQKTELDSSSLSTTEPKL